MALLSREEERKRKAEEERQRKAEEERKAEFMATELLAAEDTSEQMRHDLAKRRLDKNRKKRERRRPASSPTPLRETKGERQRQQIVHDGQKFEYAPWG